MFQFQFIIEKTKFYDVSVSRTLSSKAEKRQCETDGVNQILDFLVRALDIEIYPRFGRDFWFKCVSEIIANECIEGVCWGED